MTANPPSDEEGLGDDIFGSDVYEASSPLQRKFLPWHKPRKQFVRQKQWCEQINALLNEMQPDNGMLRYLGLPGVDLLDLRYFHTHICEPNNINLLFLGFNSGVQPGSPAQTELNISLDEVRRLKNIDASSDVVYDDICRIADERSIAWKKAKDFGTFDVVNLDLCDSFATASPGTAGNTHYFAFNRLMSLQARRKNPWLLFLTTKTGREDIHAESLRIFQNTYRENLEYEEFQVISKEKLQIEDADTLKSVAKTSEGHLNVFLVGLCKWILGLGLVQTPQCKIEVKSTIGYRVNGMAEHDDLVSIALRFEPTFGVSEDSSGLSTDQAHQLDEGRLAVKILKQLNNRRCADKILAGNTELYEEMVSSTEELLALARYDIALYRDWLAAH